MGTGWNIYDALVGPGDVNGDQRVDLLARERATGHLWLYRGTGSGAWLSRVRVGSGWQAFNALVGPGDVDGDGVADVLARQTSTGYLWLYASPRLSSKLFTAVMSPGDLTGDRVPDVLARDRSGLLWLYARTAGGGWRPRVQVGSGWTGFNALF